jgi:formylglycine-generating enzyme required for sulfatase activity
LIVKKKLIVLCIAVLALAACYNPFLKEKGSGSGNGGHDNVTVNKIIYPADMVLVKAGSFQMGANLGTGGYGDQTNTHTVTLTKDFYMCKYPVTQEMYQAVMGSNPSYFTAAVSGEAGTPGKLPVERVSWYDALVFCNKLSIKEGLTPAYKMQKADLSGTSTNPADWGAVPSSDDTRWNSVTMVTGSTGYRLPTEAQWEYAAKGGHIEQKYDFAGSDTAGDVAWYDVNSGSKTHKVMEKAANALGLYDMSGNVYELCWDLYGAYSSGAQTDPEGASSGTARVIRGGGWGSTAENCRSAYRISSNPSNRYYNVGFRLVRP